MLRGSLFSPTPLSDLIFGKMQTSRFATIISEPWISMRSQFNKDTPCNSISGPGISMRSKIKKDAICNPKKMILKAMFQKSTNKFLFAQADEDFIDVLFSLLIVPLGLAEWLLKSNSGLKNIDHLHRSIVDHFDDKYLKLTKEKVMKPVIHEKYCFKPFLPICHPWHMYLYEPREAAFANRPYFVGGSRMYRVANDLTVTPLCMSTTVSLLDEMKVSLSDVEEVEFKIGLEEVRFFSLYYALIC